MRSGLCVGKTDVRCEREDSTGQTGWCYRPFLGLALTQPGFWTRISDGETNMERQTHPFQIFISSSARFRLNLNRSQQQRSSECHLGDWNHTGPPPPISSSQIYSSVHSSNVPAFPGPISFIFIVFVKQCHFLLCCCLGPVECDVYVYKYMGRESVIYCFWQKYSRNTEYSTRTICSHAFLFASIHLGWFRHN